VPATLALEIDRRALETSRTRSSYITWLLMKALKNS
jgi:hypothetical protein